MRKGRLEVFSRALHADDASLYFVSYRDFDSVAEVLLKEFVNMSEDFQVIPASRIVRVRKGDIVLYKKSRL
jgi:hypothetical protein